MASFLNKPAERLLRDEGHRFGRSKTVGGSLRRRSLRHAGPPQLASDPNHPIILWKFVEISIMYYGKFSRSPLPGPSGTLECSTRAGTSTPPRPPPAAVRRAPAARGERASKRASERTGRRSEAPTKPRQTMPDAVRPRRSRDAAERIPRQPQTRCKNVAYEIHNRSGQTNDRTRTATAPRSSLSPELPPTHALEAAHARHTVRWNSTPPDIRMCRCALRAH